MIIQPIIPVKRKNRINTVHLSGATALKYIHVQYKKYVIVTQVMQQNCLIQQQHRQQQNSNKTNQTTRKRAK